MTTDATSNRPRVTLGAVGIVLCVVGLNVITAVILKLLATTSLATLIIALGIVGAIVLSGLRFVVWGIAHKRYPLSTTYPLSSLFFPSILGVSWAFHEQVGLPQVAGTVLIVAGVVWLTVSGRKRPTQSAPE